VEIPEQADGNYVNVKMKYFKIYFETAIE